MSSMGLKYIIYVCSFVDMLKINVGFLKTSLSIHQSEIEDIEYVAKLTVILSV
jgi:hypothetical protein